MNKNIAPCKDCEKRHPGCHAKCQDYLEWRETDQQKRAEKRKILDDEAIVQGFIADTSAQYRKRERKAKKVFRNGN